MTQFDLSSLELSAGNHDIQVVAKTTQAGFINSDITPEGQVIYNPSPATKNYLRDDYLIRLSMEEPSVLDCYNLVFTSETSGDWGDITQMTKINANIGTGIEAYYNTKYLVLYSELPIALFNCICDEDNQNIKTLLIQGIKQEYVQLPIKTIYFENVDTSEVQYFDGMFAQIITDNLHTIHGLENFDTSSAVSFKKMFYNCDLITELDLSSFDLTNVDDITGMFKMCIALENIYVSEDNSDWRNYNITSSDDMFNSCSSLPNFSASEEDVEKAYFGSGGYFSEKLSIAELSDTYLEVLGEALQDIGITLQTDVKELYFITDSQDLPSGAQEVPNTSGIGTGIKCYSTINSGNVNLYILSDSGSKIKMFNTVSYNGLISYNGWNIGYAEIIDVSGLDVSSVAALGDCFSYGNHLTDIIGLDEWNTSSVTNMSYMFKGCPLLTSLDLSNFDTSNVTTFRQMFSGCTNLTTILGITNWNTENATNMQQVFANTTHLRELDLSGWDTSNVTTFQTMFNLSGIENLTIPFDVSSATVLKSMFNTCLRLEILDLSTFELKSGVDVSTMFLSCDKLYRIEVNAGTDWRNYNVGNSNSMFRDCVSLPNYSSSQIEISKAYQGIGGYFTDKAEPIIVPTAISITNSEGILSINEGDSQQLNLTFTPSTTTDKRVTWTSSNSSVVSVDSQGVITGLMVTGIPVIITVTSKADSSVSDTISVEVMQKPTPSIDGTYTEDEKYLSSQTGQVIISNDSTNITTDSGTYELYYVGDEEYGDIWLVDDLPVGVTVIYPFEGTTYYEVYDESSEEPIYVGTLTKQGD